MADLLIAAAAEATGAVVWRYDEDFDRLERCEREWYGDGERAERGLNGGRHHRLRDAEPGKRLGLPDRRGHAAE